VLLAAGARDAAHAALESAELAPTGLPTLLPGAAALAARGVLTSLGSGPCDVVVTGSLSTLARAVTLLEPVGRTALMPDTPAALSALVALHAGELSMAESVLNRALLTELGGRPAHPRHLLLLGWTAMLRGRLTAARSHVAEARAAAEHDLEPRDELWLRALEMGVARRSSDPAGMRACWDPAREALLRHPVDLFTLLPLGELIVAAAKLDTLGQLAPYRSAAAVLLARLGNPHVWTTALHWSGLQAAILAGDPAGLGPHASALVGAARSSRLAAALARAGRSWLRVLNGDVDAAGVIAAAETLAGVGLTWDGSRLAAQAAARTTVARDRNALLQCARSLAGDDSAGCSSGSAPAPATEPNLLGLLSQREREVAELIVAGQTYREVGGRLFISAKTVEHHVARIRQRLGAGTRSDLMSRLRAELAEGA
jgi:DNA-binding CsgD family transcriptional regulator